MPTYKNGDSIKVVASDEFIRKNGEAAAAEIAEVRVNKMQFNLTPKEYQEAFREWERLKQESSQRLKRIEQQHY